MRAGHIIRGLAGLVLAVGLCAPISKAETVRLGGYSPTTQVCVDPVTHLLSACGGTDANGAPYDAPFSGAVAFVLDTPQAARRSIGANCTVAGNVALTFGDATTLTVPVSVGWQTFPFAITTVNTSGTTATCTYSNLK